MPAIVKYRTLPTELRIICWYLLLSGFSNLVNNVLGFQKINNLAVGHIYTILEFTLFCAFYRSTINSAVLNRYLPFISGGFALFSIVNFLFFQQLSVFNSYTKTLESFCMMFFAIAYFKVALDSVNISNHKADALSCINAGVLIYFSGGLVLFAIQNIRLSNHSFWEVLWVAHASFLFIMYQLFALGLWWYKK